MLHKPGRTLSIHVAPAWLQSRMLLRHFHVVLQHLRLPPEELLDQARPEALKMLSSSSACPVHRLTSKKVAEKKLAITVFSFPPDKGNVGTAAYLNVFGSIYRVLQDLQREGYNVGEIPADEKALMEKVCYTGGVSFSGCMCLSMLCCVCVSHLSLQALQHSLQTLCRAAG